MTRSQLITKVANDTGISAVEVEKIMDGIFGTIGDVRETCKALNAAYQGRGGGKPGFCQGSLAEGSFEQVKAFLLKSLLLREKVAEAPTEAG